MSTNINNNTLLGQKRKVVLKRKSLNPKTGEQYSNEGNHQILRANNIQPQDVEEVLKKVSYCANSQVIYNYFMFLIGLCIGIPLVPVILWLSGDYSGWTFLLTLALIFVIVLIMSPIFFIGHYKKTVKRTRALLEAENKRCGNYHYDITFFLDLEITVLNQNQDINIIPDNPSELNLLYIIQPTLTELRSGFSLYVETSRDIEANRQFSTDIREIIAYFLEERKNILDSTYCMIFGLSLLVSVLIIPVIVLPIIFGAFDTTLGVVLFVLGLVVYFTVFIIFIVWLHISLKKKLMEKIKPFIARYLAKGIYVETKETSLNELVILVFDKDLNVYPEDDLRIRQYI